MLSITFIARLGSSELILLWPAMLQELDALVSALVGAQGFLSPPAELLQALLVRHLVSQCVRLWG